MAVFKFEAECVEQACEFLTVVSYSFRICNLQFSQGRVFTDLEGEVEVDSTLSELIGFARQVDDGHAIVESLRLKNVSP